MSGINSIPCSSVLNLDLTNEEIIGIWLRDIGSTANEKVMYVHTPNQISDIDYADCLHAIVDEYGFPATMKTNWDVRLAFHHQSQLAAMLLVDLVTELAYQLKKIATEIDKVGTDTPAPGAAS